MRDEFARIQPTAAVSNAVEVQQPVIPRVNTRSRTIHRSAASQSEMERLPSGFEYYDPPQSSQQGPFPGPKEYPRYFRPTGSRPLVGDLLPSIETNSLRSFSPTPALAADTIVVASQKESEPNRQRRQHRVRRGRLPPYEQRIVFN